MARRHGRKDLLAALLIIGTALVYWMSRNTPDITFDDRSEAAPKPAQPSGERVGTLPGLRRAE